MTDWQKRMLTEREELALKIRGLTAFLCGPEFMKISENERTLMNAQLQHMADYHAILVDRILFYTQQSGDAE